MKKNTSDFVILETRSDGPTYKCKDNTLGKLTKSAGEELRPKYP